MVRIGAQGMELRAQGTEHRAQGTEQRAQSTGHGTWSMEHGVWGMEYGAQPSEVRIRIFNGRQGEKGKWGQGEVRLSSLFKLPGPLFA
jgi:hypothetical protein